MTVGLVLVSHSRELASAAVALAAEMAADVPVQIAAGVDGGFGTDAAAISEAITSADAGSDGAGVVVVLDLGSAVLSAEMALELVDAQVRARTIVTAAPMVEGLVIATIVASTGAARERVAADAEQALQPKQSQLHAN